MAFKIYLVFLISIFSLYRVQCTTIPNGQIAEDSIPSTSIVESSDILEDAADQHGAAVELDTKTKVSSTEKKSKSRLGKRLMGLSLIALVVIFSYMLLSTMKEPEKELPKEGKKKIPKLLEGTITREKFLGGVADMVKTLAQWNSTFNLPGTNPILLKDMLNEEFDDWKEATLTEMHDQMKNAQYDPKLTPQDIVTIKEGKKFLVEHRITDLLELTNPVPLIRAVISLKDTTARMELEFNVKLPLIHKILDQLDGTKVVTLHPDDHVGPLRNVLKDHATHSSIKLARNYIKSFDNLIEHAHHVNNMIAQSKLLFDAEVKKLESTDGNGIDYYN